MASITASVGEMRVTQASNSALKDTIYKSIEHLARDIVSARPDRALWGTDWPHLTDGSRDSGELVNLLLDWIPDEKIRHQVLVENPARLFSFEE